MACEEKSSLRQRTGNTLRRFPKTIAIHRPANKTLRKWRFSRPSETLLTLKASPHLLHEADIDFEAFVPYSLKKKARWLLHESLIEKQNLSEIQHFDANKMTVEEVTEIPRVIWRKRSTNQWTVKEVCDFRTSTKFNSIDEESTTNEICFRFAKSIEQRIIERTDKVANNLIRSKHFRTMEDFSFQNGHIVEERRHEGEYQIPLEFDEIEEIRTIPAVSLADYVSSKTVKKHKKKQKKKRRHQRDVKEPLIVPAAHLQVKNAGIVFVEAEIPEEENKSAPIDLNDNYIMEPLLVTLNPEDVGRDTLLATFNSNYWEGASIPRHFAIDISDFVCERVFDGGPRCRKTPLAVLVFEAMGNSHEWSLRLNVLPTSVKTVTLWELKLPTGGYSLLDLIAACVKFTSIKFRKYFEQPLPDLTVMTVNERASEPLLGRAVRPAWNLSHFSLSNNEILEIPFRDNHFEVSDKTCSICFDDVTSEATALLKCSHHCCDDCWRTHLISEVKQGRLKLRCPAYNCAELVDHVTVLRFISLALFEQHRKCRMALEIEENYKFSRCPNSQCQRMIEASSKWEPGQALTVRCVCSRVFCLACRGEGHWPATCEQWSDYKQKAVTLGDWKTESASESLEAANDLMKNIKVYGQTCPKCRKFMEKSVGCNSMICYCGTNFCYQCGRSRQSHPSPGFPCSYQPFERMKSLLKTRMAKPIDTTKTRLKSAENNRGHEYCKALLCRLKRFELGNSFRFRQKYGTSITRLYSDRYNHDSTTSAVRQTTEIYFQLTDMLRLAEYCYVLSMYSTNRKKRQIFDAGRKLHQNARIILDNLSSIDQKNIMTHCTKNVNPHLLFEVHFKDARTISRQLHVIIDE